MCVRILTSAPAGPAALLSRWPYRWFKTSRSRFWLFFWGANSIAWKLTGKPYLSNRMHSVNNTLQLVPLCNQLMKLM